MSHTPHELSDEFPEHREKLHSLKLGDAHFRALADDYHRVNREIHRIESETEAVSDEAAEALKKQRLNLKDKIAAMLQKA